MTTALINVIDKRFNRGVWRLQARQRISSKEPVQSEEEVEATMADLLKDYPQLSQGWQLL